MDVLGQLPWEAWGVVGAIVAIVLVGIWAAKDVVLAILRSPRGKAATPTPPESTGSRRPGPSTMAWMEGLSASKIKAQADEGQDERLNRLEDRIDGCYSIEGTHRTELLAALKDIRDDGKDYRKKNDRKNAEQDNLLRGLSDSIHTIQGIMQGKRGGTGGTEFFSDKDKPK